MKLFIIKNYIRKYKIFIGSVDGRKKLIYKNIKNLEKQNNAMLSAKANEFIVTFSVQIDTIERVERVS
jgi:hypothetical protein